MGAKNKAAKIVRVGLYMVATLFILIGLFYFGNGLDTVYAPVQFAGLYLILGTMFSVVGILLIWIAWRK